MLGASLRSYGCLLYVLLSRPYHAFSLLLPLDPRIRPPPFHSRPDLVTVLRLLYTIPSRCRVRICTNPRLLPVLPCKRAGGGGMDNGEERRRRYSGRTARWIAGWGWDTWAKAPLIIIWPTSTYRFLAWDILVMMRVYGMLTAPVHRLVHPHVAHAYSEA